MPTKRLLPPGCIGSMRSRTPKFVPTSELGWLSPIRAAKAGGGYWLFKCRCGNEVSKLARYVRKHAESGATPKCSVKCAWKESEQVA